MDKFIEWVESKNDRLEIDSDMDICYTLQDCNDYDVYDYLDKQMLIGYMIEYCIFKKIPFQITNMYSIFEMSDVDDIKIIYDHLRHVITECDKDG
jgi:hypothetical protein